MRPANNDTVKLLSCNIPGIKAVQSFGFKHVGTLDKVAVVQGRLVESVFLPSDRTMLISVQSMLLSHPITLHARYLRRGHDTEEIAHY